MQKFGIDISVWQKGFNFDKAKAEGVEFAILRGAYHLSKDKCFEDFYSACKARNIPVGVYLYSMAKTVATAKAEAENLIANVLKGKQFEYPIYMDIEDKAQRVLGKDLLTEIVITFCDTLEKAGYYVGIYSTASFLSSFTHESKLSRFDKWIAQWAKKCSYKGDYGMWQFGGETNLLRTNKVAGVVCDQDYAYKDYPAIIKGLGLNGFDGESVDDEKQPVVEPQQDGYNIKMRTLKRGDKGEDVRALQILLAGNGCKGNMYENGYGKFGGNTEEAVRLFKKKNKLPQSGECDEPTWKKLLGV